MCNKYFLVIPFILLCSMVPKNQNNKNELLSKYNSKGKNAVLVYIGSIKGGTVNFDIGVHIIMDSTIGLRYDVTFQNGTSVFSHIAIFYKFSNPYQTVYYNFLNHKTEVIKAKSPSSDPDVTIIGQEKIDSFNCTHLSQSNKSESQDYWMSRDVPGFSQLVNKLNNIDPGLEVMAINQSIFNWGGLVRLQKNSTTNGQTVTMSLKLFEATSNIRLRSTDFDVPTK